MPRSLMLFGLLTLLICTPLLAQGDSSVTIAGVVTSEEGVRVEGVNVFVLETLEGTVTGEDGRFLFPSSRRGRSTLVVRRIGFQMLRTPIFLDADTVRIALSMVALSQTLRPVPVVAGRYSTGDERGAVLTPLEVVTTPGAHADVARALQSLPGVQNVDEGTALFVRGGDYTETKTFIDGALLINAFTYDSPGATFIGTVDPFLLDGIHFSSGGFGAKHGDAMSGVASLKTQGRAKGASATFGTGLAALSASAGLGITSNLGVRSAVNVFDTDLLFRVNRIPPRYPRPPRGHDLSANATWDYRPTGQLKAFAIDQSSAMRMNIQEAAYSGTYDLGVDGSLLVVNWKDVVGPVLTSARVSRSTLKRAQEYGSFRMLTDLDVRAGGADAELAASDNLILRAGLETEQTLARFNGSVPSNGDDRSPGARTNVIASRGAGNRVAVFGETEWRPFQQARAILGLRTDHSSLTNHRTLDPRASFVVEPRAGVTLTAAWGVYHQVPDPLFFDATAGSPSARAMRATHTIAGVQLGDKAAIARVELYEKGYRDLAQMTRDYDVVTEGTGRTRGADVFAKGPIGLGVSGRVSYSLLTSHRTDPNTGVMARAPFDVTHTGAAILERAFGGLRVAIAQRGATGRPVTPVSSAVFDAERNVWTPQYAAPMSERLPHFTRTDLSASYFRMFAGKQAVLYGAITNAFDRTNVYAFRYSADYQQRFAVRSLFNRSVYGGASLIFHRGP